MDPHVGVTHGAEIPFVFYDVTGAGDLAQDQPNPFADKLVTHKQLANLMTKMWISFITDMNPISTDMSSVQWPEYKLDNPQNLGIDANATDLAYIEDDYFRAEAINFIIVWGFGLDYSTLLA